jgi:hypothetical protein
MYLPLGFTFSLILLAADFLSFSVCLASAVSILNSLFSIRLFSLSNAFSIPLTVLAY